MYDLANSVRPVAEVRLAFLDEFMAREADWRAKGGRFIVPIPEFRVV